jgi:hypothetical protein
MLGRVAAVAGRTEDAWRFAEELEAGPMNAARAQTLAQIYASLGDREKTFHWLEWEPQSFARPWIIMWPQMDAFREDPRFQAMFRRMNLALEPGRIAPVPLPPEHADLPKVSATG